MRCNLCGGRVRRAIVRYVLEYRGRVIIVQGVPCRTCGQCGQRLFDPDVVDRLQKLVLGGRRTPARKAMTPVYQFA